MRGLDFRGLPKLMAGHVEQTFQVRLGVVDPPLIDYLSALLARFIHVDEIFKLRNVTGAPISDVVGMMAKADKCDGAAKREAHRQIGDFTLFWVGVYPEGLRKLRASCNRDQAVDYHQQGKRAYWTASTVGDEQYDRRASELLERLSLDFELCAYGLREVRRSWEDPDSDQPTTHFL